jgi:hypothetical protein
MVRTRGEGQIHHAVAEGGDDLGRPPTAAFGAEGVLTEALSSLMMRRTQFSLHQIMAAILGGENPWLEWSTTAVRPTTVGSRVRFINRVIASPSSGEGSRTRSTAWRTRPAGKYLHPTRQETRHSVSGRSTSAR